MERVKIIFFEKDTGEIYQEVDTNQLAKQLIWKERERRRKSIREFYGEKIMIFQKILKKAPKELNGTELKVFLYMLSIMDFENWINIPQKEMAEDIGIHIANLKKAIKGLKEKGYIEIIKKGRENYYRINPEIAWKGDEKSHLKVLRNSNPLID